MPPDIADLSSVGTVGLSVRPLGPDDDDAVRSLFTSTFLLGAPLPFRPSRWDEYLDVCLGWYLGPGRSGGALAVDERGSPVGYALWCGESGAQSSDARRRSGQLASRLIADAAVRRLDSQSRRFYAARLRDAAVLVRSIEGPHVHVNVAAGRRSGSTTLLLRDHLDETARAVDEDRWSGEINARRGTRARALERLGFTVVGRHVNHTFSGLLGQPVDRLTIVRRRTP